MGAKRLVACGEGGSSETDVQSGLLTVSYAMQFIKLSLCSREMKKLRACK